MIPFAQLKQDLEVNKNLGGIIDSLKVVASIQLREFQIKRRLGEEFLNFLNSCLEMLEGYNTGHYLLTYNEKLPTCIVIVTSDEGFLGELNTLLVNTGLDNRKSKEDEIVVIGERGCRYVEDAGISYVGLKGISDEITLEEVEGLGRYLIDGYLNKQFGRVLVVYAYSASVSIQHREVEELLPYRGLSINNKVTSTKDVPLKISKKIIRIQEELLIEPSVDKVVEGLVRLRIIFSIYNIFWSSKFSEFAARLMHLEGSDQELSRINQQLSLQYFRHLHTLADKSIREISASKLIEKHQ